MCVRVGPGGGINILNDPTWLTALILLRACLGRYARADHLVSVPQACEPCDQPTRSAQPTLSKMNSSGSLNLVMCVCM